MPITKEEVCYRIKIPWDLIKADSKLDKLSPYDKFYIMCVSEALVKNESFKILYCDENDTYKDIYDKALEKFSFSVSDFWLSKKDFIKLRKMEINYWAKRKKISLQSLEELYMSWRDLDAAPCTFARKPKWAEYGTVYIKAFRRKNVE